MKKFLLFLMVIVMLLSLVACGEKESGSQNHQNTNGNQQQNTNGSQQGYKAPTIDELTAAFINKGYVRETEFEYPFTNEELPEYGLSKAVSNAARYFQKSLGDDAGSGIELYYFKFADEADATEAFYTLVDLLSSENDIKLTISSGKNGLRVTGEDSDWDDGYQFMISQAGNTLVWATESWDRYDYDENQYDGQMPAILSSLGY